MARRIEAVIFDMIETVFSLEPVRGAMVSADFDAADLETWFAFGLRDAFAAQATGSALPFPDILGEALEQLAATRSRSLSDAQKQSILGAFAKMPAHDGAETAFRAITQAGLPILALSNGPAERTRSLLEASGLDRYVASVLSVEDVGSFKPFEAVYDHGVHIAGTEAKKTVLAACHAWDCHGAKRAGLMSAFVRRGQHYPAIFEQPDLTADDLPAIAEAIIHHI